MELTQTTVTEKYTAGPGIERYYKLAFALQEAGFKFKQMPAKRELAITQDGIEGIIGMVDYHNLFSLKDEDLKGLSLLEISDKCNLDSVTELTVHPLMSPKLKEFAQSYQPEDK